MDGVCLKLILKCADGVCLKLILQCRFKLSVKRADDVGLNFKIADGVCLR